MPKITQKIIQAIDPRVRNLKPSFTLFASAETARLRAEGRKIYNLGLGANPIPPPRAVVRALADHAHRHEYTSVRGIPGLAEVIAKRYDGHSEGVIVGPGLKELIYGTQRCYGGEIVHVMPYWVSYSEQTRIAGKQALEIHTRFEDGCKLLPEQIDELEEMAPDGPKMVIFNHPCNPTGVAYSPKELSALAEVFRRYGWVVFADEVYLGNHHLPLTAEQKKLHSLSHYYPEGTIRGTSLSKEFSGGGWRLGTLLFPKELSWLKKSVEAFGTSTYSCAPVPQQYAAKVAFGDHPEVVEHLELQRQIYSSIGNAAYERVCSIGLKALRPSAAWYLWVDFSAMASPEVTSNFDLGQQLLAQHNLVTVHGSAFGAKSEDLFLRLSLIDFDGQAALKKASEGNVDATDLAPNIFEALAQLKK